jgi:hypothetical protein
MKYFVEVIEDATGKVERRIECSGSERQAEKVQRGVEINLNHEDYSTRIVTEDEEPKVNVITVGEEGAEEEEMDVGELHNHLKGILGE